MSALKWVMSVGERSEIDILISKWAVEGSERAEEEELAVVERVWVETKFAGSIGDGQLVNQLASSLVWC